jgi:hypothetical protein
LLKSSGLQGQAVRSQAAGCTEVAGPDH